MTANIFGNRFVSHREPAWHKLGYVFEEAVSANKAFDTAGRYKVELRDLQIADTDLTIGQRAILRPAINEVEDVTEVFGIVGADYHLLSPDDAVNLWDEHIARPLETFGVLGKGETLFMSTYLPTIDVKGDEVRNYLLYCSQMTGSNAEQIIVTPQRTVCENTLIVARDLSTDLFRVRHDEHVKVRVGGWLTGVYERAEAKVDALKEVFGILATKKATPANIKRVTMAAYPDPKKPSRNAPDDVMEIRFGWYDENVKSIQRLRDTAVDLFHGSGTGMDITAAKGTLWGLYNAVVELEDYKQGGNAPSAATSSLFGTRAAVKQRAFSAVASIAGINL